MTNRRQTIADLQRELQGEVHETGPHRDRRLAPAQARRLTGGCSIHPCGCIDKCEPDPPPP